MRAPKALRVVLRARPVTQPLGTPTLCWLDVGGEVLRSNVTPFLMRTLVPSAGHGPDGIAVDLEAGLALDHARGFVYYTSAVGDVGRARLDGSEPESLLADGGAFTGIVIVEVP